MNKFVRFLSAAVIGMFTLSAAGCVVKTQAGKDNTVVAIIGDEKIKVKDIREKVKSSEEQVVKQYGANYKGNADAVATLKQIYDNALTSMVREKVLYNKAKGFGLLPTSDIEAEVQKQLDEIKANTFENDQKKFEEGIKVYGYTMESLRDSLREDLKDNPAAVAAGRVQGYITRDVKVEDKEIEEYYNSNIVQYTKKPGATLSHILVDTEEKAKDIKAKLDNGAKFEDLAAENNTDSTKTSGGSLGFIAYDDANYDKDFMAAAKKLGENQISGPVKSQFGWHIIKATGIVEETKVQPLSEVKADIKKQLLTQKKQEMFDTEYVKWEKALKVKTYPTKLEKNIV